jgi:hypothetical protein
MHWQMRLSRDAESATGVALTAITAFVAVAPCPTRDVPIAVVVLSALALIGACLLRSVPLAVGVCLAFIAYTLEARSKYQRRPESFTIEADDSA